MLVHFPIALLVVASVIDWWQAWRKRVTTATTVLFFVGVGGAWLAVMSGLLNRNWLLANRLLDTPELQTLSTRHQWLSIAAATVFSAALALKLWKKLVPSPVWAHALQVIGMALLVAATHLGGLLAHGEG